MNKPSTAYVNDTKLPDMAPPASTVGLVGWVRSNLFSSPSNAVLTVIGLIIFILIVPPTLNWTIFNAVWAGGSEACKANPDGACWPFVSSRWEFFLYGFYDRAERWRVDIVLTVLVIGIGWLLIKQLPFRKTVGIGMLAVFPVFAFFMLHGAEWIGLPVVQTEDWGGFMLTLVIALTGIVASLPLGILLALGRRSEMPFIRTISTLFIEFWRGVPLITVLFMASVMFPLFLPPGVTVNQLLRALVGVALFSSAYMAEVVRGGLQAIPKGQYEGAMSLGLPFWKTMNLIVMPQALKIVIPGIVNNFIGLFKDTTLVLIIGLFDFLGAVQASTADPNWSIRSVPYTGYAFTALVFWICCYSMAVYSKNLEEKLNTGHKR